MPKLAKAAVRRPYAVAACAGVFLCGIALTSAHAQAPAKIPDFSSNDAGWISIGTNWVAMPGSPPLVSDDPAHPYVPNNTGKQPTFRVADTNNPNLTQFAKDELKKSNDEVLRGKAMYARESRCWATGVPTYLLNPAQPTFFLQAPDKVTMIWQMDHQVRRVYLNVPHSENPQPSWYGESVGYYDGNTLVVDTIGQHTRTFVDNYRTPHSDKLHVVERFMMVDGGKALRVDITFEDPDAFTAPWSVTQRYDRVQRPMAEEVCAENNQQFFKIPVAEKPDF
jgi:hypothetical protein